MTLSRDEALDLIVTEGKATEFLNVPSVREALHSYLEDEITEKVERSKKYNHLFFIGFSVNTDTSLEDLESEDFDRWIPVGELKDAVMRRVEDLFRPKHLPEGTYYEIYEAIGLPEDTYENEDSK